MGFVRVQHQGVARWGRVEGDQVSITAATTLAELLGGAEPLGQVALAEAELVAPVDETAKVLCIGLNYKDHAAEVNKPLPDKPVVFTRYPDSLVGGGAPILLPPESETFDYEAELAVVIGTGGRRISRADALDHVLGYTILNDGSIREYQMHTPQFGPGKNWFQSGAVGPWIVARDDFGAVGPQRIVCRIGDEVLQDSTLDQMVFDVPALIEYVSTWTPLRPGDVIATGTPAGVGAGRDPKRWMRAGETIEITVDGLPALTNPIVAEG